LLVRPCVDRAALADEAEQTAFAELNCGPLIEALEPRSDHRVVDQPTETLLVGDVPLDVARKRVEVRDDTVER
jgi:hypothetical protein